MNSSPRKKIRVRYRDAQITTPRPNLSYNELILEALSESPDGMLSLQEIYAHIANTHAFFQTTPVAWQNSVRHNLSVQKLFERVSRPDTRPGKGGLWRVAPEFEIEERPIKIQEKGKRTIDIPQMDSQIGPMDTLASIALSAESNSLQDWEKTSQNKQA